MPRRKQAAAPAEPKKPREPPKMSKNIVSDWPMESGMVHTLYLETDHTREHMQKYAIERGIGPESPANTLERLGDQARLNKITAHIGVINDTTFLVMGQWHSADGRHFDGPYKVIVIKGVGATCNCDIGEIKTGAACAHIAAVHVHGAELKLRPRSAAQQRDHEIRTKTPEQREAETRASVRDKYSRPDQANPLNDLYD